MTDENDSTREIVARMIDGEAFGAHAMSYRPGRGDFTSNWQNRRDRAYRTADEVITFLAGRLFPPGEYALLAEDERHLLAEGEA